MYATVKVSTAVYWNLTYPKRTSRPVGARTKASTVTWVYTLCQSTGCACTRSRRLPIRTGRPCSVRRPVLCTRTTLGTRKRPHSAVVVRTSRTCWTAPGTTSSACSNFTENNTIYKLCTDTRGYQYVSEKKIISYNCYNQKHIWGEGGRTIALPSPHQLILLLESTLKVNV